MDYEYEFCHDCQEYGEPNGCNREFGACSAYHLFTSISEERDELKSKADAAEKDIEIMLGTQRVCFVCKNLVPCSNSTTGEYACDPKWRGQSAGSMKGVQDVYRSNKTIPGF